MATNLSEMIDMSLRVSVVVVCPLMLGHFDSNLRLCFQMIVCLVGATDLHRYTQIKWQKSTNSYKVAVVKAQKENEALESQFAILKSENTALTKALEEAKAAKDEAIVMANSLKSK